MICSICKRRLRNDAMACLCGWTAETAKAARLAPEPTQSVTQAERRANYARVRGLLQDLKHRPLPNMLAHWRQVLARQSSSVAAKQFAKEAIATLERGDQAPQREPGEDDDLPLGVGRDPLEVEFGAKP